MDRKGLSAGIVFKGPVYTPPIKDYFPQDGKYVDKTNYFDDPSVLADFESIYTKGSKAGR